MANIKFVNTRDIARRVAREEGVTWQDMGSNAPKGERWAVVFPEIKDLVERAKAVEMNVPTAEDKANIDALRDALNMPNSWPVKETATVAALDTPEDLEAVLATLDQDAVTIPAQDTTDALKKAFARLDVVVPVPASIVRETVSVLKSPKGKDVTVFTKRRVAVK